MTCKELILDLLADYLDETLADEATAEARRHLDACPACVAYLSTYEQSRRLTRATHAVAMPEDLRDRLRSFLLEHLSKGSR